MPLCSISLLCCVFPICGITHLFKKAKKRQVRIQTGLSFPQMKFYDIISFLEIVFHLPDTPSFSFFTVYLTTPFFSILSSPPPRNSHFLPKYFHHLSPRIPHFRLCDQIPPSPLSFPSIHPTDFLTGYAELSIISLIPLPP